MNKSLLNIELVYPVFRLWFNRSISFPDYFSSTFVSVLFFVIPAASLLFFAEVPYFDLQLPFFIVYLLILFHWYSWSNSFSHSLILHSSKPFRYSSTLFCHSQAPNLRISNAILSFSFTILSFSNTIWLFSNNYLSFFNTVSLLYMYNHFVNIQHYFTILQHLRPLVL